MSNVPAQKRHSVVKSAVYFAFGTLMSRVLGLLRDALLVGVFGTTISDAYFAAFRFPNLFRRIFGEGALSACFIPLYVEFKETGNRKALGQLTAGVLGLLMLTLLPLSLFVSLSVDWMIPLWVGGKGFSQVPGKIEMTVLMTQIMFPFLILVSLYAYFMAILNANKKFLLSSLATSLLNLAIIAASLWCYWENNLSPSILAWSVIVGGFLQFIVLIPALRGLDVPFEFSWSSLSSNPVKRTLKAFLPSVLGLGIIQIMAFINTYFATTLDEGAVSYIYLADRLLELPLSIIAVSLGTALLPSLSEILSRNDMFAFKEELQKNIHLLLFLCLPSAVGLWMTSDILVPLLFQRGAFTTAESQVVSIIVKIYAFTLISASVSRLLSQAFYAGKNTLIPSLASLFGLIVHLILAPFFMEEWGINGLVLSTTVASFLNMIFLLVVFHASRGGLSYGRLIIFVSRSMAACFAIVAICFWAQTFYVAEVFYERVLQMLVCVGFGAIGYFSLSALLGLQESRWVLQKFRQRLAKKKA